MCGFVGILIDQKGVAQQGAVVSSTIIQKCLPKLGRRGPDAEGVFADENIVLGHTRLAIQDLSKDGNQPLVSCSRETVIAFNGEIYNFKKLREELLQLGCKFKSKSDTEVIVNLYESFGIEFISKLKGIFRLRYGTQKKDLILVRDRLGIKPLYVAQTQLGLAFSSEISRCLAFQEWICLLTQQALSEYLWFGNSFENRTFYQGIRPLSQVTFCARGQQLIQNYWSPDIQLRAQGFSDHANIEAKIRDCIDEIVTEQTISDVPLGLFLSGGIDLSTLAAAVGKKGLVV